MISINFDRMAVLYLGNGAGYESPRMDPICSEAMAFCLNYGLTAFDVLCERTRTGNETFKHIVANALRYRREHPENDIIIAMPRYERQLDCMEDIQQLVDKGVMFIFFEVPSLSGGHTSQRDANWPTHPDAAGMPKRHFTGATSPKSRNTALRV